MNNQGIRNAWEEIHNQPYRAPDKVPARVIDAPIPEEFAKQIESHFAIYGTWMECNCRFHRAIKVGDDDAPKPAIDPETEIRELEARCARLEAEKQEARRIGLEFALHLANETADWCIEEQEKGYLGAMRVADAIKKELANTVKPQGDAHTEGWNAAIEKLPPFNKMVWVAAPMWFIGKDGSKEYSPFCDVACLKDGPVQVWMTPNFEGYTFEEITHWRPLPILPEPTAAKQGEAS